MRNFVFTKKSAASFRENERSKVDFKCSKETLSIIKGIWPWYQSFKIKYLQSHQRIHEISLCKSAMKSAASEPRIFFVGKSSANRHNKYEKNRKHLAKVAYGLVTLKDQLKSQNEQ